MSEKSPEVCSRCGGVACVLTCCAIRGVFVARFRCPFSLPVFVARFRCPDCAVCPRNLNSEERSSRDYGAISVLFHKVGVQYSDCVGAHRAAW